MKNKWIAIVSILTLCVMGLYFSVFAEDAGKKSDEPQAAASQIREQKGKMGKGPGMDMGKGMGMGKMKAEMLEKVKINVVHEDNAVVIKMVSDDPETLNALKKQYAAGEELKGPAAMRLVMAPGACACPCPQEKCQKDGKCVCSEECKKACGESCTAANKGASCAAAKEGAACAAAKPAEDAEKK